MPELDLKMDRHLWGLTLWIWSYMLQMAISQSYHSLSVECRLEILSLIQKMKGFKLTFKDYSLLKYPIQFVALSWHYWYRVKPFTYDKFTKVKG